MLDNKFSAIAEFLSGVLYLASMVAFVFVVFLCVFFEYFDPYFISVVFFCGSLAFQLGVVFDNRAGGISFLVSFFMLMFIAYPAMVQVGLSIYPWRSVGYSSQELADAFVVLAVAMLSFSVASFRFRKYNVIKTQSVSDIQQYYKYFVTVLTLCLFIIPFVGMSLLLSDRSVIGDLSNETGVRQQFVYIGRSLSLFVMLYFLVLSRNDLRNVKYWLAFAVSLVVFFIFNYPAAVPRFQLLGCLLAVLAVFVSFFRVDIKLILLISFVFFLFYFFPSIKMLGYGGDVSDVILYMLELDIREYILRVDFDAFMQIVDTVSYAKSEGYRYGYNFLGVLLFFVPRGIWPQKPIDSGDLVSTYHGYYYNNVSSPLPAEAYISFGIIGVVLVFYIFSLYIRKIEAYVRCCDITGYVGISLLLYFMLIGYSVIIMRGALNGVAPQFASAFLAYFFFVYIVRKPFRD
ncbi:hypothetical protein A3746_16560 [Oleibacter sp. HI0075]|nr:hypothetical protein A3746_16560 [Oleibacter sp. HI0075]